MRRNGWVASFLLALFVVGGLVAPVVHRAEHALHVAERHAAAEQAGHVHTDFAAFSTAFQYYAPHDLACILCSTVSVWTGLQQASLTRDADLASFFVEAADLPSSTAFLRWSIRGPPPSA